MSSPAPSLGDSLAALRTATLAAPAPAWLPAAIHALILACFARIFACLEDMLAQWQAGIFPPPPPARAASPARDRPAPPPPSLFARIAGYFSAAPEPAYAAGRTSTSAIRRVTREVRSGSGESKNETGHRGTETRRSKQREKCARGPIPLGALAWPCSSVSLCLCVHLLGLIATARARPIAKLRLRPATPTHIYNVSLSKQ
jgi:hypothetical protein